VGGVVGGVAFIGILVLVALIFYLRHRKQMNQLEQQQQPLSPAPPNTYGLNKEAMNVSHTSTAVASPVTNSDIYPFSNHPAQIPSPDFSGGPYYPSQIPLSELPANPYSPQRILIVLSEYL
jgi:hypothetical protein